MKSKTLFIIGICISAPVFAGCDFIGEMIADKVTEKVAEEVTEEVAEQIIEKSIEEQGGGEADVELEDGKLTVKGKDGNFALGGGHVDIPKDFPKDVPIPKNVTFRMAMSKDGNHSLGGASKETAKALSEQLAKESEANGWVQKKKIDMGKMAILHYEKDDRQLTFQLGTNEKKGKEPETIVSIAVKEPKKRK